MLTAMVYLLCMIRMESIRVTQSISEGTQRWHTLRITQTH